MAVCRDIGSASTMTVKYGSGTGIHIIGTQILAAHENTPTTPHHPLPQNKYHSKCHASCIRRNVSCRPQMLLVEKQSSTSTITANKEDNARLATAGVR
jgi:hypothetical protein